ncbi:MAG: bifunctional adenosylcobinamide kinase/adenosylcobinamide-phosphate guanylyltransferase, partial [Actinomycetota bacterium]|nr:bifunctional adenosylcobinamide kinase/adenosylcobinamide-phosphate guanylyltransferase [Actinomycetota bacterium]
MPLTLLIGGARSGKSSLAAKLAVGAPVSVLVTGEPRDGEMAERIRRHRAARPEEWAVHEEPVAIERVIDGVDPGHSLVLDCLTLWVSNLLEGGLTSDEVERRARRAAELCAFRPGSTIAITNEVG